MKVMLPELAAVVAGRDLDDARSARGVDADAHRVLDGRAIESVHDDLEDRVHTVRERLLTPSRPRSVGQYASLVDAVIFLYLFAPTLLPAAHDAAGEGQDDAADLAHRPDSGLRRGERGVWSFGKDQEVAATDRLLHAEGSWTRNSPSITGMRQ